MSSFSEVIVPVQVLIRDEEDSCFGLWMLLNGKMTEIPLAGTEKIPNDRLITGGVLIRPEKYAEPAAEDRIPAVKSRERSSEVSCSRR